MRKIKKQLALLLALVMCLAMGITANAAPSPSGETQTPAEIAKEAVIVPEGSGIKNLEITAVPSDSPARASITALIEAITATGVKVEKSILVDITAEGSGEVQFNVGKEYAGQHVYLKHYNGTSWEDAGSGVVSAEGIVTFVLKDFSPYAILITSTKSATPAASSTSSESSSSSSSTTDSSKSPKTGETMTILAVELLAAACVATVIIAGKKVKRVN